MHREERSGLLVAPPDRSARLPVGSVWVPLPLDEQPTRVRQRGSSAHSPHSPTELHSCLLDARLLPAAALSIMMTPHSPLSNLPTWPQMLSLHLHSFYIYMYFFTTPSIGLQILNVIMYLWHYPQHSPRFIKWRFSCCF